MINLEGGKKMTLEEIRHGESENIEFKVQLPDDSKKYMKTIVAFANTAGGKLIIGIDDKTKDVIGVDSKSVFQIMDRIANAVSDMCVPQIVPDITFQTIEGKCVVHFRVNFYRSIEQDRAGVVNVKTGIESDGTGIESRETVIEKGRTGIESMETGIEKADNGVEILPKLSNTEKKWWN